MKHLVVNYKNKRSHIIETIDLDENDSFLSCKIEVLKKYVILICPYVDLKNFNVCPDRHRCIRLEKLIRDEIDYLNKEEFREASFSINVEDDHYIKYQLSDLDDEN